MTHESLSGQARHSTLEVSYESFAWTGFVGLFIAYVVMAVLIIDYPLIGYAGMAATLSIWVVYPLSNRTTPFIIPRANVWLTLGFTAAISLSSLSWKAGADLKDVVALYLFFIVVPSSYVALNVTFGGIEAYVRTAFEVVFFSTAAAVLLDFILGGFTVYRSNVLGINKNGVSYFFEVLYAYLLFDSRNRSSVWTATVIVVGYTTLLMIFSKTSIGFGFAFTLGYFSPILFFLSGTVLAVIGVSLMLAADPASLFVLRTAVDRFLLWQDALQEIMYSVQRFLLGYGPGNFVADVRDFGLFGKRDPHNYFLKITHSFGAVTFAVLAAYFAWILRRFGILTSGPVAAFWMFNLHSTFDVGWVAGPGFLASLVLGMILARGIRND